jgi:hypothetical protein
MAEIPILVKVKVRQTVFDPDAIDTLIYCVNNTESNFVISSKSESFTTIDEETGETVKHGSQPAEIELQKGEAVKIADVEGWEWDGHVGIEIVFMNDENEIRKSYDFKRNGKEYVHGHPPFEGLVLDPLK